MCIQVQSSTFEEEKVHARAEFKQSNDKNHHTQFSDLNT